MDQAAFFDQYAKYAIDSMVETGVPASITLAQAALESGWGQSKLTREANNFFGIKDQKNDDWTGPNYQISTREVYNGKDTTEIAKFRKYRSPEQSFIDHGNFLRKNKRYAKLFNSYQWQSWAYGLQDAGYATDPNYAKVLIGIINKYGLAQYDKEGLKRINKRKIEWVAVGATTVLVAGLIYFIYINKKTIEKSI